MDINILEYGSEKPSVVGNEIKKHLDLEGYVLLKNYCFQNNDENSIKNEFLSLCRCIGTPISHDNNNTLVWDIKKAEVSYSTEKSVVTYSEHSHVADLHTDSQYSKYPEDYFGLMTLCQATCGGGVSHILKLSDLLKEIKEELIGESLISTLSNSKFPFVIPQVFKLQSSNDLEFNFGPILGPNEIRFRIDTIQKAINANPHLLSEKEENAFHRFTELVRASRYIKEIKLEDGDLLFINNKSVLHGRSAFTDMARHLLRVRMNRN